MEVIILTLLVRALRGLGEARTGAGRRAGTRLPHLLGDALRRRPVVEIIDADVGTVPSKRDRHPAPDALLSPCDRRYLSVELPDGTAS